MAALFNFGFPCNWYSKNPNLKIDIFWNSNWWSIWKMTIRWEAQRARKLNIMFLMSRYSWAIFHNVMIFFMLVSCIFQISWPDLGFSWKAWEFYRISVLKMGLWFFSLIFTFPDMKADFLEYKAWVACRFHKCISFWLCDRKTAVTICWNLCQSAISHLMH